MTRSVDFLPEIFQTDANKQFLGATLDVLTQEPKFKKKQGYIGRTVGPGLDPQDRYVSELTKQRSGYQLEPAVCSLDAGSGRIKDVISYPGIIDAITFNGGNGTKADRLYESDYYTWDPFVDYDPMVNYGQYYWLPAGPDAVSVRAERIASQRVFDVTREDGAYVFSGEVGNNPTLSLVRGGVYTFQVKQNSKETVNYRVANEGTAAFLIDGRPNPTLTLERGNTYVFNINTRPGGVYEFWIKTQLSLGDNDAYNQGVSRNGSTNGLVTFVVPYDAPDTLYYTSQTETNFRGTINIVDAQPGTGPGFWIQAQPGISGTFAATPNISSRDVFGVINNGLDLGTITFSVPSRTAQQYYYDLPEFATPVDLITDLKYDQINNQRLDDFIATYGGIDGIQGLDNRTLVINHANLDTEGGGWIDSTPSLFDPLATGDDFLPGSFDSYAYDEGIVIPVSQRRQLYLINVVQRNNISYLSLSYIADIPINNKFTVRYGTENASTTWFKPNDTEFERVPLLTALLDTLYYQDGTDPEAFGLIKILDDEDDQTIFIDDIIGSRQYTANNGVQFTNGLKVIFEGSVFPETYGSNPVEIDVTGTSSLFNTLTTYSTVGFYEGQRIVFGAPVYGTIQAGVTYYIHSVVNELEFTITEVEGGVIKTMVDISAIMSATLYNYREYYVEGVGESIELLPVEDFVTPEAYVVDADDSTIATEPAELDYITVRRNALNRNAWSRSNRWFHIDVINATATYNNTVAVLANNSRAKRPILQYRPNLRMFDMGTEAKDPVDVIDFAQTDAFSNVSGATSYSVDGVVFENGTRVIFAADEDPQVASRIYIVEFVEPDSVEPLITQPIIRLRPSVEGPFLVDQQVLILQGTVNKGKTYRYDGTTFLPCQAKTSVQQFPLFDVYDNVGVSYGNTTKYPSTNFRGSRLFGYKLSDTTILDAVLNLPLTFLSIANVGDLLFTNYLYDDSFIYTLDNVSVTKNISEGAPREYTSRTAFTRRIGWKNAATTSKSYQQFKFVFTGAPLVLDVRADDVTDVPVVKIYRNSIFVPPDQYTYERTDTSTTIFLPSSIPVDSVIEVLVLSSQTSNVAFYQVPTNLENNPFNANTPEFSLGIIRKHYGTICENLLDIQGVIQGANNTRDLGDISPFGLTILQQSAPLTLAGYFLHSNVGVIDETLDSQERSDIFEALRYNSREYIKYKNLMLDAVTKLTVQFQTPAQLLDEAIDNITSGRTDQQPFYWSDMLPSGVVYTQQVIEITSVTTNVFDLVNVYDFTTSNYQGLLVYLNDQQLIRGRDYTVATDGPRITILTSLALNDILTIREYATTYGSFCPNTPSKLGLYPLYRPEVTVTQTSTGLQSVIIGHDGSQTRVFNDIRDDVLLEFETRIYNNIKLDGNPIPFNIDDILPGQFRETGYSFGEIQNIFNQDFLSYVAWNKLDYNNQTYVSNNAFTYNYSSATNKLNNDALLGNFRGIYRYFYDTETPHLTPWRMLGFSEKPVWWDGYYGSVPYTSDNLVLWEDLEQGLVRDPAAPYVIPKYTRPGLTDVIPVDSQGNLLPPISSVVGIYEQAQFRKSWSLGDGGPVESSWWNSSAYPFAVMRVLALSKPAKFFALFADRDLYRFQSDLGQYLYNNRYRLDAKGMVIYGDGVSKASYINWIVDWQRRTGINATRDLQIDLDNLDVRLVYRFAGFTDKQYVKIFTEKASPDSANTGLLIPDESYELLLYKNQPFARNSYSAVLVQQVAGGYAVFGYSTSQPYFNIRKSINSGRLRSISVLNTLVKVPTEWTDQVVSVPYGFIFSNAGAVADFLLSYGKYLEDSGLTFDNMENGYQLDWNQMVNEFLYWSQQGWQNESLISLNPLATKLQVSRQLSVVDNLRVKTGENVILDQNRRELPVDNLNVVRLDNTITIEPVSDSTINFVDLRYTSFEHIIVFDNTTIFNDLIYDPILGIRQGRLNMQAVITADWNGTVNTPGFVLNRDNINDWSGNRSYAKGEIVLYKNQYWSSLRAQQPTTTFNTNDWLQSDFDQVQLGLLPNIANKADQLAQSYDINSANLERDSDLLSYGLIGFRPRDYMVALSLDDVSQVNIYRQFLKTKGTLQSSELFSRADLGKEAADYSIYENWAIRRGIYGANANRSFIELRLDQSRLNSNPSILQIVDPQQTSEADQTFLYNNLWRQSFKVRNKNVLPVTRIRPTDISLPSAGYVNLDDVDITAVSIDDPAVLEENIDTIIAGTTIWVAKSNSYDWNIYRTESVPGYISHVCDNLDSTSLVIFSEQHGLSQGQQLIIKFFDSEVDGVYEVLRVVNLNKIIIGFSFTGDRTVVNGVGLGFTLQTMRVAQFSDVTNLPYANDLLPGARIWVDDNGQGDWQVLEKKDVFTSLTRVNPQVLDEAQAYGSAIAQSANRFSALVGSPEYDVNELGLAQGAVYTYVRGPRTEYSPVSPEPSDALLKLDNLGARGYGSSLTFGSKTWAAAGAPASFGADDLLAVYPPAQAKTVRVQELGHWRIADFQPALPPNQGIFRVTFSRIDSNTYEATAFNNLPASRTDPYLRLRAGDQIYAASTLAPRILRQLTSTEPDGELGLRGRYLVDTAPTTTFISGGVPVYRNGMQIILKTGGGVPSSNRQVRVYSDDNARAGQVGIIKLDESNLRPGFNPYTNWQILTDPQRPNEAVSEFGTSVAMSEDERWLYVGAPAENKVLAYARIPWEDQIKQFEGDGVTTAFVIGDRIQIDALLQVQVFIDGTEYTGLASASSDFGLINLAAAPAAGSEVVFQRRKEWYPFNYTLYTVVGTGGTGSGARFQVTMTYGKIDVAVQAGGSGYTDGDTITLAAASVWQAPYTTGSAVTFDVDVTDGVITGIKLGTGEIDGLTYTLASQDIPGTSPPVSTKYPPYSFQVGDYLFGSTNSYSFSIWVDDVLQRPGVDYDFDPDDGSTLPADRRVTWLTLPPFGAEIKVRKESYWDYVDRIDYPGAQSDARFGQTVSCTTDGRQLVIGAPNETVSGELNAGAVYVIDRNVQRFIYGQDPSTVTFTVLGTAVEPVAVKVNNRFLINQDDGVIGETNSFTVNGNDVTVNTDLRNGDVVEIETNQFAFVQTVTQSTVEDNSVFGSSSQICSFNCSLYIGAPTSSAQIYKGGVVERNVNQARLYGTITSTLAPLTLTAGETIRINNQDIAVPAVPNNTVAGVASAINSQVPNVTASSVNGRLQVTVANRAAASPGNLLQVAPGTLGTVYTDLGFEMMYFTQTITSPYPTENAAFGHSLSLSDSADELVIGTPYGNMFLVTIFDEGVTDFDAGATIFFAEIPQSGTVYVYNLASASSPSITNPSKFVIGQQLNIPEIDYDDRLGWSVSYRGGILWSGAIGSNVNDSSSSAYGQSWIYENVDRRSAWQVQRQKRPGVDVRLLNTAFLYDFQSAVTNSYLDFFNPLQGKILGVAKQNIDYIGVIDPAEYNQGTFNNNGSTWAEKHIGQIWWDISTVRFLDPNQANITYTARQWGQIFPGCTVDIYQWIESDVSPADYDGPGTPFDTGRFTITSELNNQGVFETKYYFWVTGLTTVATDIDKTLSTTAISNYIADPRSSGIPYLAPISSDTVAIYNCANLIEANDTILHIEFDKQLTNDNVHMEYELLPQDRADGFLSDDLYRKMQDSFCGVDTVGNIVPDIFLSPPERYGVLFRPRQSMFVDRFEALRNYIGRANDILALYPIVEIRQFDLLNSFEPIPDANSVEPNERWNLRVANLEILGFQNIYDVPVGYRYLVESDSSQRGRWTIYEVVFTEGATPDSISGRELLLSRVQNYNTLDYWGHIDWYQPGFNRNTKPVAEVSTVSSLDTLSLTQAPVGSVVRVTANAQGKFELWQRTETGWDRVALQDGTIAISDEIYDYTTGRFGFDVEVFDAQFFDQEPVVETRKIIQAINQELFIDDLLLERNQLLVLMFNYVLSEQGAPEWLMKTSFIDVDHKLRELLPFQLYVRDNQEFVIDYIQEVKPYHVQVREFNLQYFGSDTAALDLTDFDLPAYFNNNLDVARFTSPVLLPYEAGTAQVSNNLSDTPANSEVWQQWPYSQWYANYLFTIDSIFVSNSGSGYTGIPQVVITGDATVPTEAVAVVNGSGQVIAVNITNPGSGYRDRPVIAFVGGNGTGAQAYPRLTNGLVREFKTTIKYDRFQYQTAITDWNADVLYPNGTRVRYDNRVWQAESADGSSAVVGPTFDLENWQPVAAGTLPGLDRTFGFYVDSVNSEGRDMPQLIDGLTYPGVQVFGEYFLGSSPNPVLIECTETDGLRNRIRAISTQAIEIGQRIKFTGSVFGGIEENRVYFVSSVFDFEQFSISTSLGGFNLPLTTAIGSMTAEVPQKLDVIYQNSFENQFVGTRPQDINVEGGEFIGVYEGHAPEELVNGSEFDSLDMRVITRSGSDWQGDGHGFEFGTINYVFDKTTNPELSYDGVVEFPVKITVSNKTSGLQLAEDVDFSIDYVNKLVTPNQSVVNDGDEISITVFEVGGGRQVYKVSYQGSDIPSGIFDVPVQSTTIDSIAIFVDGAYFVDNTTWLPYIASTNWSTFESYQANDVVNDSGSYYRAAQDVPIGVDITNTDYWLEFTPTLLSRVTMQSAPASNDWVDILVLGKPTIEPADLIKGRSYTITVSGTTPWTSVGASSTAVGTTFTATGPSGGTGQATTDYDYSLPEIQQEVITPAQRAAFGFVLTGSLSGSNRANLIVYRNGQRLQPPHMIKWEGDDSSVSFGLPQRMGAAFTQDQIDAETEIQVWVDDVLQTQTVGASIGDYGVSPWTGSNVPGRQVVFENPPRAGASVVISVTTLADYVIDIGTSFIEFVDQPDLDDVYEVWTWNDTSQQNLLTQVWIGPEVDPVSGLSVNNFDLLRSGISAERLIVHKNGLELYQGKDYTVQGSELVLLGGLIIGSSDVVISTQFAESVVPEQASFRIFQDMRGVQSTYRIREAGTTVLVQDLAPTDDVIYMQDVSGLDFPNLESGVFGLITVGAERIQYRNINTALNTVSGLRRGTAGTAISAHATGTDVYNIGDGDLLYSTYQDYTISGTVIADGSSTLYQFDRPADDPWFLGDDSTAEIRSLEVYVGGQRAERYSEDSELAGNSTYRYVVTDYDPLVIEFVDLDPISDNRFVPPADVEITVVQRRGKWWYHVDTEAQRQQSLQESESDAARFLTGRE